MTLYANLDFTKSVLKASQPTTSTLSTDDMRLVGYLRQTSLRLDSEFSLTPRWPYFAPWNGTRKYLVAPERVNNRLNTFQWKEPLLALTGNITVGTVTLVVGTDVELWPDSTQPPFYQLRLLARTNSWYWDCLGCVAPVQVSIPGIWGYHRDYATAWPQLTTLNGVLSASQTNVIVTSASAPDPYGITPGISVGSLLQIDDGTGEMMEVTAVNASTKTLTVLRGVNGTTAVAHTDAAAGVLVFQVEPPVQIAVARQAALMYARLGAFTTVEVQGMSEIRYPADWLWEVRAMMQSYAQGY